MNQQLFEDVLVSASEFIKDRLYFVTLKTSEQPRATTSTHYFSVENTLRYESFFSDFGPLNICMLHAYCNKLNNKFKSAILKHKKIVHTSSDDENNRLNAACLIGCYAIIYLDMSPQQAHDILTANNNHKFVEYRDASVGEPYTISLLDCLQGLAKARQFGFFDLANFDAVHYEYYERVENGDLNWIVPNKFLAFCGPHNKSRVLHGYPLHAPNLYFDYFRRFGVTTIVRLNKKMYDANKFIDAGFQHFDLFFVDGSTPTDKILRDFLGVCERAQGAIAVHCKAGLGRTGTLIACYLMKHYKFRAREAIAWIRMCRPGSVIGHQQVWLEGKQEQMHKEGRFVPVPMVHKQGIYADSADELALEGSSIDDEVILKVDTMQLNDNCGSAAAAAAAASEAKNKTKTSKMTQGDHLNHIKALRRHHHCNNNNINNYHNSIGVERKVFRTRVLVTPVAVSSASVVAASPALPAGLARSRVLVNTRQHADLPPSASSSGCARRVSQRRLAPRIKVSSGSCGGDAENAWIEAKQRQCQRSSSPLVPSAPGTPGSKLVALKRGKRSLHIGDKDKLVTSVKVLRRSQPSVTAMTTATGTATATATAVSCSSHSHGHNKRFSLPLVKNNRTK